MRLIPITAASGTFPIGPRHHTISGFATNPFASLWAAMHLVPCISFVFMFVAFQRCHLLTFLSPQFKAAQLLRLAEKSGAKTLGNTWYVPHHTYHNLSTVFCRRACQALAIHHGVPRIYPFAHVTRRRFTVSCGLFCNLIMVQRFPNLLSFLD